MKYLLIVLSTLIFSGCSTIQDAQESRGSGKSKTFAHSYDNVWDTTVKVVDESKLDLIAKNKESGEVLAQKGLSAFSYGENVAVFVEKESEKSTKVEVISKRALATNVVAKNWSNYILDKISESLK